MRAAEQRVAHGAWPGLTHAKHKHGDCGQLHTRSRLSSVACMPCSHPIQSFIVQAASLSAASEPRRF